MYPVEISSQDDATQLDKWGSLGREAVVSRAYDYVAKVLGAYNGSIMYLCWVYTHFWLPSQARATAHGGMLGINCI